MSHFDITQAEYEDDERYREFWARDYESWKSRNRQFPIPVPLVRQTLAEQVGGFESVMDFGCNFGRACNLLFPDERYVGVDIIPQAIEECRKRIDGEFVLLPGPDPATWPELPTVDLAWSFTVLVHLLPAYYERTVDAILDRCRWYVVCETDSRKVSKPFRGYCYNRDYRALGPVHVESVPDTLISIFVLRGRA